MSVLAFADGAHTTIETWGSRGPLIVCIHGMTSSRKSWTRFAAAFSDRYRVVAYDQRGHGDSAGVTGPMTLAQALDDLACVERALGEPVEALIGHSWGGAVAILGGEVSSARRVVAVDPMIVQVAEDWYGEFIAELDDAFTATGAARDERMRSEYAHWAELDREGKVHAVHAMTTQPIARLLAENPAPSWDLRACVAGYEKPLLLAMAGDRESIVPPPVLEAIRANHGPQVQIETFVGEGHNLHRTGFDAFAQSTRRFLES